jgi:uncharacterized protein (DUF1810 family)
MQPIYNLERFLSAQESVYDTALLELKNGRKQTHWVWFVFPQVAGLGRSEMARYYAIKDINEAKAYLDHPVLRNRFEECLNAVLSCKTSNPVRIFGEIDALKFHSSLTLFLRVAPDNELILAALAKFYGSTNFATDNILDNQHY